jgi:hypothetical protein
MCNLAVCAATRRSALCHGCAGHALQHMGHGRFREDVNGPTFLSTEIQRGRYRLTPSKQLFASREPVRQPMSERHHATDPERAINIAHNRLPGIFGNIGRRRLKVSNAYRLCRAISETCSEARTNAPSRCIGSYDSKTAESRPGQ